MPSFILIHPTIWPQYTNVTDKQDRHRSVSIAGIGLQRVAQKTTEPIMKQLTLHNAKAYAETPVSSSPLRASNTDDVRKWEIVDQCPKTV